MSSKNEVRIKTIRPKQEDGSFSKIIPLGTDGYLVDMISQLDLEQENRIGGNHYTDVKQTPIRKNITEWYFSEPKGATPIEDVNDDIVTYTVSTIIEKMSQSYIIDEEGNFINISDQDGDFLVFREQLYDNETTIKVELYKGNFKHKLHEKTIHLYKDNDSNHYIIDEQVDEENSLNPFRS